MGAKDKTSGEEVNQILDLVADLNSKVRLDGNLAYISDDQYDRLADGLNDLTINIFNHKLVSEKSTDRLDELTDIMTSMAQLDFSQKATVTDNDNHLDYLGIGLNLLSAQLRKETGKLELYKNIVESTHDLVIVTNGEGIIKYVNNQAGSFLGYASDELVDESMDLVLNNEDSSTLMNFTEMLMAYDLRSEHGISYNNVKLEFLHKARYAYSVNMSVSVLRDSNGTPEGLVFIIPNQSTDVLAHKLKGVYDALKGLISEDTQNLSKKQYQETINMVVEELGELTEEVVN